eukprot:3169707-Rhodomonas_salina.1
MLAETDPRLPLYPPDMDDSGGLGLGLVRAYFPPSEGGSFFLAEESSGAEGSPFRAAPHLSP